MVRVLLMGMSGVGKTTVLVELRRRGHMTVDTDYDGWESPNGTWDEQRMDNPAVGFCRTSGHRAGGGCSGSVRSRSSPIEIGAVSRRRGSCSTPLTDGLDKLRDQARSTEWMVPVTGRRVAAYPALGCT